MINSLKTINSESPIIKNQQTLIIFTRYPEAGKTKTRLIPALGEKGAADFQRQMTEITINKAKKLTEKIPVNIEVHFQGGNRELMEKWLGKDLIFREQKEGDLGAKMLNAFNQVLSKNNQKAVIIGIDCPDLNEFILEKAFEACQDRDLVMGPAQDGGYYLIGLNKVRSELFRDIKWGTSEVFRKTENIAKRLSLKIHKLPVLNDIDRPEDLSYYKSLII
jgi:rSAM/selenodomain-associated transferase 1